MHAYINAFWIQLCYHLLLLCVVSVNKVLLGRADKLNNCVCGVIINHAAWRRHQMETFSALLALCEGNWPVTSEFPAQRSVTRSFDIFFEINSWINNRGAGNLRRHRAHHDVTVMVEPKWHAHGSRFVWVLWFCACQFFFCIRVALQAFGQSFNRIIASVPMIPSWRIWVNNQSMPVAISHAVFSVISEKFIYKTKSDIFEFVSKRYISSISCEISLWWMP